MARSNAKTVNEYLSELEPDRRAAISEVRKTILRHLPNGYQEAMNWGLISYEVPLARYPQTYNKQPLMFAGLAAQKNYCTLHLMSMYQDPQRLSPLTDAFANAGKKLKLGKACIQFQRSEDLPLDAIGNLIASVPLADFIAHYESVRAR